MTFREQWKLAVLIGAVGLPLAILTASFASSQQGRPVLYAVAILSANAGFGAIALMFMRSISRVWWFKFAVKDPKFMKAKQRRYLFFGRQEHLVDQMFNTPYTGACFRWWIHADRKGHDLDGIYSRSIGQGKVTDDTEKIQIDR